MTGGRGARGGRRGGSEMDTHKEGATRLKLYAVLKSKPNFNATIRMERD